MRLILVILMGTIVVVMIIDIVVAVLKQHDSNSLFSTLSRIVYNLNSFIFFSITIGLIVSTLLVSK